MERNACRPRPYPGHPMDCRGYVRWYNNCQRRVQATDAESYHSDTKAETAHNEMDAYSAHGANDEHPVENVKVKVTKLSGGGVASFNVDGSATVAVL
jgi:hypothetical protein